MHLLCCWPRSTAAAWSQKADAVESARELASYCQKLERGTKGAAQHIQIPNTKEAAALLGIHASDAGSVSSRLRGRNQDYGLMSAGADDSAPTDPFIRDLRAIPSRRIGRQHAARCVHGIAARLPLPPGRPSPCHNAASSSLEAPGTSRAARKVRLWDYCNAPMILFSRPQCGADFAFRCCGGR